MREWSYAGSANGVEAATRRAGNVIDKFQVHTTFEPVASQNVFRTNDRSLEAQSRLVAWLWTNFEGTPFRVREVAEILRNSSNGDADDVMADADVVRNGVFDNVRLGRLLRKLEGKIISGLRLAREGTAQNATCWRISNTQTSWR